MAEVRELTPALVRGAGGWNELVAERALPSGLRAQIVHHAHGDSRRARRATVVLLAVPPTRAWLPALVCRDRDELRRAPAQLPAERWEPTELESIAFNNRYRLLTLRGQSAGLVRELFSPELIDWLSHAPEGLSFELNEGHLAVLVPGHLEDDELDGLVAAADQLAARIRAETAEESGHGDVFTEREEREDLERALAEGRWERPPDSVAAASTELRRVAMRKPRVLAVALFWALAVAAPVAVPLAALLGPLAGLGAAAVLAPGAFLISRLIAGHRYRWGTIALSRAGVEAFARGYARSRGLLLEDRWRFHAEHRELPLSGFADHVFAGALPGSGVQGRFLMLADAAELRSRGAEVAHTTERPWASNAIVVALDELRSRRRAAPEPVDLSEEKRAEYRIEQAGDDLVVWRAIPGNLLRTAQGSDLFCARAAALALERARGSR